MQSLKVSCVQMKSNCNIHVAHVQTEEKHTIKIKQVNIAPNICKPIVTKLKQKVKKPRPAT